MKMQSSDASGIYRMTSDVADVCALTQVTSMPEVVVNATHSTSDQLSWAARLVGTDAAQDWRVPRIDNANEMA